jgi:hypothetical protein
MPLIWNTSLQLKQFSELERLGGTWAKKQLAGPPALTSNA